jgi:undecaprenol kinase
MGAHKNQSLLRRMGFALAGLAVAWRTERSLRLQLAVFVAVVITLLTIGLEPLWWAVVLATSSVVIAAELFNTAIEHLVDHLHPETHPRIGTVKDCAAAAVLVSACGAVLVGAALAVHLLTRH